MTTNDENLNIFEEYKESYGNYAALRNATEKVLNNILINDPILSDIPCDISYEEALAQIAVVKGQAITIFLERENLPTLKIIVPESKTTVSDLKKAIRRAYDLEQNRINKRKYNNNDNIHYHQHNKSTKSSSLLTTISSSSSTSSSPPPPTTTTTTIPSSSSTAVIINHSNTSNTTRSNSNNSSSKISLNKKISWKYIWRTYLLDNNGRLLIDNNQLLINYGVVNKTILKFVKRCKYQQRHKQKRIV